MTTVLIAGANRGLGLEFVTQYVADGATIIAGCRDPAAATDLKALSDKNPGKITVHALDVADDASVAGFKAAVGDTPIDIFIANAGVGDTQTPFGQLDFDAWLKIMNVNTLGPIRLAQAFAGNVAAAKGKLVAITSRLGSIGYNTQGQWIAYRTAKAGLNMAFKNVALELKDKGVITALLHPGHVQTDMGGASAPFTPQESIAGMRKVIAGLTPADNGSFHDHKGEALPW